jgi:hypothetical protein
MTVFEHQNKYFNAEIIGFPGKQPFSIQERIRFCYPALVEGVCEVGHPKRGSSCHDFWVIDSNNIPYFKQGQREKRNCDQSLPKVKPSSDQRHQHEIQASEAYPGW